MQRHGPVIKINDNFEMRIPLEEDAFQLSRVVDANRSYLKEWLPWLETSKNAADSLVFIQKIHSDWKNHQIFTALIYKKNEIVGAMGFHGCVHRRMSLGYWVSKEYAGKGLCSAASHAIIAWAFSYYDYLHMVDLRAAVDNLASRRVAEKLGFIYEGILRDQEWLYDHFVSHAIYTLTRKEFARENN